MNTSNSNASRFLSLCALATLAGFALSLAVALTV